ncbi:MAG: chemotaxis response regulator protein-glutamate methylesterase [Acidimicrobiia bacterium]
MGLHPNRRAKVLITDDAVVVRRLVSDVLAKVPTIDVVGTAANGKIALQKIEQLQPDLVILDIEMPVMDGIETLVAIRGQYPNLPVIMFSTLTERGTAVTLEALMRGANDYVTKPANVGSVTAAIELVRDELVPRILALTGLPDANEPPPVSPERGRRLSPQVDRAMQAELHRSRRDVISDATTAPPAPSRRPPRDSPRASAATNSPNPARRGGVGPTQAAATPREVRAARPQGLANRVDVVTIGISTGGPNALAELLPQLPLNMPVPIVIVQHMPPMFTKLLAERLNANAAIEVVEAKSGDVLQPGKCWIAPGDFHLEVGSTASGSKVLTLNSGPKENSCRPAADVLFRSVAKIYGVNALAVVMTGMGRDGMRGSQAILDAGGQVIAQDQASSVVWGMPGAVVEGGITTEVYSLTNLPNEIMQRVSFGRVMREAAPGDGRPGR